MKNKYFKILFVIGLMLWVPCMVLMLFTTDESLKNIYFGLTMLGFVFSGVALHLQYIALERAEKAQAKKLASGH